MKEEHDKEDMQINIFKSLGYFKCR